MNKYSSKTVYDLYRQSDSSTVVDRSSIEILTFFLPFIHTGFLSQDILKNSSSIWA